MHGRTFTQPKPTPHQLNEEFQLNRQLFNKHNLAQHMSYWRFADIMQIIKGHKPMSATYEVDIKIVRNTINAKAA